MLTILLYYYCDYYTIVPIIQMHDDSNWLASKPCARIGTIILYIRYVTKIF